VSRVAYPFLDIDMLGERVRMCVEDRVV